MAENCMVDCGGCTKLREGGGGAGHEIGLTFSRTCGGSGCGGGVTTGAGSKTGSGAGGGTGATAGTASCLGSRVFFGFFRPNNPNSPCFSRTGRSSGSSSRSSLGSSSGTETLSDFFGAAGALSGAASCGSKVTGVHTAHCCSLWAFCCSRVSRSRRFFSACRATAVSAASSAVRLSSERRSSCRRRAA